MTAKTVFSREAFEREGIRVKERYLNDANFKNVWLLLIEMFLVVSI